MFRRIVSFFDKFEDRTRSRLSRKPILYALVGAVGIILLWKGVWETAEFIPALHGPGSILLGVIILLASGLLVSFFIGDNIILSGYKREKKLAERTEHEVLKAGQTADLIMQKLDHLEGDVHALTRKVEDSKTTH